MTPTTKTQEIRALIERIQPATVGEVWAWMPGVDIYAVRARLSYAVKTGAIIGRKGNRRPLTYTLKGAI